jgi:hypothetical protein
VYFTQPINLHPTRCRPPAGPPLPPAFHTLSLIVLTPKPWRSFPLWPSFLPLRLLSPLRLPNLGEWSSWSLCWVLWPCRGLGWIQVVFPPVPSTSGGKRAVEDRSNKGWVNIVLFGKRYNKSTNHLIWVQSRFSWCLNDDGWAIIMKFAFKKERCHIRRHASCLPWWASSTIETTREHEMDTSLKYGGIECTGSRSWIELVLPANT